MNLKTGKIIALFIITLILTLPIYSAQSLAATVRITSNHGTLGVEDYINAEEDTWTVQAAITGAAQTVLPENVKLRANADLNFNTCETSTALGTICSFETTLSGVSEQRHDFSVEYISEPGAPASGHIFADGSAPVIDINEIKQEESALRVNFVVTENKDSDSGIKSITITDENNVELSAVEVTDKKKREYNEKIPLTSTLEGTKTITIKAVDMLGHEESESKEIKVDLVIPIISSIINLTSLNDFIGNVARTTDLKVDVTENSDVNKNGVTAASSQIEFPSNKAECKRDAMQFDLWHCLWKNVLVKPSADISLQITAIDQFENQAEATLTKTLTLDNSAPEIVFFGTEKVFEQKNYLNKGENNWLVVQINEVGSGIVKEKILANLADFGEGTRVIPTDCLTEGTLTTCYWQVNVPQVTRVSPSITEFEDNSGNPGLTTGADIIIDNGKPKVEEVSVYGVGDGREKDSFMSRDQIKIDFKVVEKTSGINILVNLNNVVMDAANKYPADYVRRGLPAEAGWQVFTPEEANCQREEAEEGEESDTWLCSILTDEIKSGPDDRVDLEIDVQDTAGNSADEWPEEARNVQGSSGDYSFELLGDTLEERPDYWEVSSIKLLIPSPEHPFVDLDAVKLAPYRMPVDIKLHSDSDAEILSAELPSLGCVPSDEAAKAPALTDRNLLYGGIRSSEGSTKLTLLLEFEPFDGLAFFEIPHKDTFRETLVNYTCRIQLFSSLGDTAIRNAELQEIKIKVPFGFSELGAVDENLEELVQEAKDAAGTGFWGAIGTLEGILRWGYYISNLLNSWNQIAEIIEGPAKRATDAARSIPAGTPAAVAACFGLNTATEEADLAVAPFRAISAFFACSPNTGVDFYDAWIGWIPQHYNDLMNIEILKLPDSPLGDAEQAFKPARNVRENLYLSSMALCIPGIIHNLDQYRQIMCRKVYCLEQEVPANLATVESCDKLEGLLTCKYFAGEAWYILPFSQFWDGFLNVLRNALRDPFAAAHTLNIGICGVTCITSGSLSGACNFSYWLWDIIGFIEGLVGTITTIVKDIDSGGLQYCDSVL